MWGALAGSFLLVSLHRLSTGVLAERLLRAYAITAVELGALHAAFFWVYALLQLPAGVALDRTGPRRVAAAGTFVMSLGAVWFALGATYPGAVAARAVIGLGASVLYLAILRFGVTWFRSDEFATVIGLTVAVAGIGGVLATTPLALAVEAFGWRPTVLGLGLVGIGFSVLVAVAVRDAPGPPADGPGTGASTDDGGGTGPVAMPPLREVLGNARRILREPVTWAISLVLFCAVGVNTTVLGLWGVPYVAQVYDLPVSRASTVAMLGTLGFLVGGPAAGWVSDRTGRRTGLIVAGSAAYAVALAPLALFAALPLAAVAAVFLAAPFVYGPFMVTFAVVAERHGEAASGVAMGTINTAAYVGAAAFPAVMGAALDAFWTGETVAGARVYTAFGYRVAFAVAVIATLVAFVGAVWVHRNATSAVPSRHP